MSKNLFFSSFFSAEDLEMAYLLIFVILLHLITLAMLFIATMEKVAIGFLMPGAYAEKCVCCTVSLCLISLLSPGGSGAVWRTQTCGTTAGSTTSQEAGCVHPPRKQVQEQDCSIKTQLRNTNGCLISFSRVASGGAGPDGPLRGLLLGLLFGVPGPALHHVQGGTLLLHRTVSSLRRYHRSVTMCCQTL